MAYTFAAASTQYLSATASPLGTGQLGDHSISLWVKGAAANPTTIALAIGRSSETSAVNNPCVLIQNANGAVTYFMRANSSADGGGWNGSVIGSGISGGTAFDNTWHHICATLSSSTSTLYVDGTQVTSATKSVPTQTGMDRLGVGALVRGNVAAPFSGSVADVGVWNDAINASEARALSLGVACRLVRPQSLVFYAPLIRDLIDAARGLAITNNNAATVDVHPRVYA